MGQALEVKNLHKGFQKNFWIPYDFILKGLNFSIPEGSITSFLGWNGSGKTTTFKCLFNLIKKDQGEILFFGEDHSSSKVKSLLGFLPENPEFYEDLTAEELLLFYGQLTEIKKSSQLKSRVSNLLKSLELYPWRHKRIKTFSKGMLKKLGILQAVISRPKMIVLDEPFSGLDTNSVLAVIEWIEKMNREEGLTVFFSSHILQDVERLSQRLIFIKEGQIIFQGDVAQRSFSIQEQRRILFIDSKGRKISKVVPNLKECQEELEKLIKDKCSILSVSRERQTLDSFYQNFK